METYDDGKPTIAKGCEGGEFGRPITVDEGISKIGLFRDIQKELTALLDSGRLPNSGKAGKFIKNLSERDVFVFDKNLIDRFKDKGDDLTHYIVCLANNDEAGDAEGATVIFAGCHKIKDNGANFEVSIIEPTPCPQLALSEHPQKRIIKIDKKDPAHGNQIVLTLQ